MRAAIEPSMHATDVAIEAAIAGVPFRDAYRRRCRRRIDAGQGRTPESSLAARTSPGAGADLRLDALRARLRKYCGRANERSGDGSARAGSRYFVLELRHEQHGPFVAELARRL